MRVGVRTVYATKKEIQKYLLTTVYHFAVSVRKQIKKSSVIIPVKYFYVHDIHSLHSL